MSSPPSLPEGFGLLAELISMPEPPPLSESLRQVAEVVARLREAPNIPDHNLARRAEVIATEVRELAARRDALAAGLAGELPADYASLTAARVRLEQLWPDETKEPPCHIWPRSDAALARELIICSVVAARERARALGLPAKEVLACLREAIHGT